MKFENTGSLIHIFEMAQLAGQEHLYVVILQSENNEHLKQVHEIALDDAFRVSSLRGKIGKLPGYSDKISANSSVGGGTDLPYVAFSTQGLALAYASAMSQLGVENTLYKIEADKTKKTETWPGYSVALSSPLQHLAPIPSKC